MLCKSLWLVQISIFGEFSRATLQTMLLKSRRLLENRGLVFFSVLSYFSRSAEGSKTKQTKKKNFLKFQYGCIHFCLIFVALVNNFRLFNPVVILMAIVKTSFGIAFLILFIWVQAKHVMVQSKSQNYNYMSKSNQRMFFYHINMICSIVILVFITNNPNRNK